MDLNLLKIYKKVVESGSLTKASQVLGHPKSKISRDLDKLESQLKESLLVRSPRGIIVTEKGSELLKLIKEPLENLNSVPDLIKSRSQEMNGTIKLTAPEDLSVNILTDIINEFLTKYPDTHIELYSTNDFLDFKKHHIDLALRIGKLNDSALIQRKISDIEVILVASAQYLKTKDSVHSLVDLKQHPLFLLKDLYGNTLSKKISDIVPQLASNSILALKSYVNKSKGIATLPSFICQNEIQNGELQRVLPKFIYAERSLYMLSQPSNYTPKHVKVFKDFTFQFLKEKFNY